MALLFPFSLEELECHEHSTDSTQKIKLRSVNFPYTWLGRRDEFHKLIRSFTEYLNNSDYPIKKLMAFKTIDVFPYPVVYLPIDETTLFGKVIKITLTMPSGLLKTIDDAVSDNLEFNSRSDFIAKSSIRQLEEMNILQLK